MSAITTKLKTTQKDTKANQDISAESSEYEGKPVYHFRTMISEMSMYGSDLMLESL